MADPRTDEIAREAARLIQTGRSDEIGPAIRIAAETLGYSDAPQPGFGRVRKHAQAMRMQALGQAAYEQSRRDMWAAAEEMLATIEQALPEATAILVGRAAQGFIDAGVTIHIRLYTRAPLAEIVSVLVEYGYDEPSFETAHTRHGRLSQLRFFEDGQNIVITICVPGAQVDAATDLFTSKPIEAIDLRTLRQRMNFNQT